MHRVLSCCAMFRYPSRSSWPGRTLRCVRRRSWGSALRSVAPARQALDRSPIRLTHLPFSERRPDDFVGGPAVLYTVQIFLCHPLCERQPIADVRRGFWVFLCLADNPFRSVSLHRSGRDCRGLCLSQVFGTPLERCPRGLEDRVGRQPPEIRFRLLSAHELGLVTRFGNASDGH
jgi:hypothetical protein